MHNQTNGSGVHCWLANNSRFEFQYCIRFQSTRPFSVHLFIGNNDSIQNKIFTLISTSCWVSTAMLEWLYVRIVQRNIRKYMWNRFATTLQLCNNLQSVYLFPIVIRYNCRFSAMNAKRLRANMSELWHLFPQLFIKSMALLCVCVWLSIKQCLTIDLENLHRFVKEHYWLRLEP